MPPDPTTYAARWIFPVAGAPLSNGTVTILGERIEAVSPHGVRTPDIDLGNVGIVPGLVNAHTHLDLGGARGIIPPTDPDHFTDWLRGVIAYRRLRTPEQVQADIREGLVECVRHGTSLIGDITAEGASWDAVAASKTRAIVYWELIGLDEARVNQSWDKHVGSSGMSWEEPPEGVIVRAQTRSCKWGYSPHAPYSVNAKFAKWVLTLPNRAAVHLAESPAEIELLMHRSGHFVEFLTQLGIYVPIRFGNECG